MINALFQREPLSKIQSDKGYLCLPLRQRLKSGDGNRYSNIRKTDEYSDTVFE